MELTRVAKRIFDRVEVLIASDFLSPFDVRRGIGSGAAANGTDGADRTDGQHALGPEVAAGIIQVF